LFEIVFLGTSASAPSVHRGLTSQVVLRGEHRFLIDAGEGTQRQILSSGLGFKRLDRILITHGHLDHILGLGGLLLFGVVLKGKYPPVEITLEALETGLLFDEGDFTVSAFPVYHRTPDCFGFAFEERARRPFLPDKAEVLKIPPGPWRGELVRGEAVTLPDGRVIHPEMVLGEEQPGPAWEP